MSSSAVDTTVRLSFALVNGLVLAILLPVLYMFYPVTTDTYLPAILFLGLPAVSYAVSLGLNALTQYISCGNVSPSQIALASAMNPVYVFLFAFFSWLLPFLRSFVSAVLPEGADETMKISLSYSFYLLWGGLYGQVFSGGFAQACPSGAGPK